MAIAFANEDQLKRIAHKFEGAVESTNGSNSKLAKGSCANQKQAGPSSLTVEKNGWPIQVMETEQVVVIVT